MQSVKVEPVPGTEGGAGASAPDGDGPPQAPDWRIWLGMGLSFTWLVLGALYLGQQLGWGGFAKLPADVLGNFLEGAFAPLAFLWLVIGYFIQQKELSQNTSALRMQFREIQRSAEQAEIQANAIAESERHARQETFLKIADTVRRQLGVITGLLYISSQSAAGSGAVSDEEISQLWRQLNQNDPELFQRRMLEAHLALDDPDERMALFYGTAIRARHSNNIIFTFERLLSRAREVDTDDMIVDALTGSAAGFVCELAKRYQALAPAELQDVERTGRHISLG